MRAIRREGTSAELVVGRLLYGLGQRYRKNVKSLPGSPDFANKSRKWAIFVNGCFWHRHTACTRATIPKSNQQFWLEKFAKNRKRDATAVLSIRRLGFCAIIVWECETADQERLKRRLVDVFETRGIDMR
ncbi:DNA mismatch endonuclease Vsr [Rhizobium sp. S-51]|uniref:Very short patch repair endonuclease n=2 Tax=Rhizobium terricola TaxID=2728849 RepID=A0A7Y0ATF6_9HYPH|nr:DNA mismatch endonuclease Vsr [Rhizobium terricola]